MKRRDFIAGSAIGAATALTQSPSFAKGISTPSLGESLDSWSQAIDRTFNNLPKDLQLSILRQSGAADLDELKLTYAKRFPSMTAHEVLSANPKIRDLLQRTQVAASDYEKSNTHDKESHDKGPDHDKGAFSRT